MASFDIDLGDMVSDPAKTMAGSLGNLTSSLSNTGVASDGLTGSLGELAAATGPVGIAIAVAVVALVAFAAAAYAAMSAAVSITQQRDALRNTFDALGEGAGVGAKTLAMLDRLGKTLPFTTDQMAKWAKSLMAAGIQGPELEKGIQAIAAATAIMGESGGAAADKLIKKMAELSAIGGKVKIDKGLAKQLAAAGVSMEALAAEIGTTPDKLAKMSLTAKQLGDAMQAALLKKGKGPLEALGLTWDTISSKLKEGIASIFEDLGPAVQPFMAALKSLFGEFNKGSMAAQGMKGIVTSVLTTLFTVATRVVNGIHIGALKLYIGWLKVKMAIAPVTSAIGALIPKGAGLSILMGIVKGLAVIFGLLAVAILIGLIPLALLIAAIVAVGYAIYSIGSAIVAAVGWLANMGSAAVDAAGNFIAGLINGIKAGAAAVVAAVVALANGAIGALKSALHLGSPSKLTMKMGGFTAQGLADGIEDGATGVRAAAKGTGRAAIKGTAQGLSAGGGAAGAVGAGMTVNVELTINGAGGDIMSLTEEAVALIFERVALREGLVTP